MNEILTHHAPHIGSNTREADHTPPDATANGFRANVLNRLNLRRLTATALAIGSFAAANASPAEAVSTPHHAGGLTVQSIETTANLSEKMAPQPDITFSRHSPREPDTIVVNDKEQYQRVQGFGAAITDSSAWLINGLSEKKRVSLMEDLFSRLGIHLNYVRIALGASDFTAQERPYSFDEQSDPDLRHFSIKHDEAYIIPVLRLMRLINPGTNIVASPWSPPGWLKTNGSMINLGNSGDSLLNNTSAPEDMANYYAMAAKEYNQAGVYINAITPQNEPTVATSYPSMSFPELDEQNFIPLLANALRQNGLDTDIYGNDSSFDQLNYASALATVYAAGNVMRGLAWHCYEGNIAAMNQLYTEFPNLNDVEDECSPEIRGLKTISELIASQRNGASAFILWNMALNSVGGPVQPPNQGCTGCNGVVTINNGRYYLGPKYYQLGQVSSLVYPGARRIGSNNFVEYSTDPVKNFPTISQGIDDVAYKNKDGSIVVVVVNTGPSQDVKVAWGNRSFDKDIPTGATVTFAWKPKVNSWAR